MVNFQQFSKGIYQNLSYNDLKKKALMRMSVSQLLAVGNKNSWKPSRLTLMAHLPIQRVSFRDSWQFPLILILIFELGELLPDILLYCWFLG
jgi:hypothetical protein